ncbi:MAG TPA: hypothetical protein VMI06_20140 [Terriglobia bacterium]|nr:hypothetical protein [Terriglobia bacterium]
MVRRLILWVPAAFLIGFAGGVAYRAWPRIPQLQLSLAPRSPICVYADHHLVLRSPSGIFAAEVGTYKDELQAYLRFDYLASRQATKGHPVFLSTRWDCSGPAYRVGILLPDDLLTALPYVEHLRALGFINHFYLECPSRSQVDYGEQQTLLFETAYNNPIQQGLKEATPSALVQPLARFLVFKSQTDRRVREGIEPVPITLSLEQARQLAKDIITVAEFYGLPVSALVGVGAMENDFMNANGDLQHAVWKRRAAKGDIVVKRWRRRVLVCDSSVGIWQLTRQTLQYAHSLYLQDRTKRDYTALPARLRPPLELGEYVGDDREALTTYAGLLLRHLVDRFHGNLDEAIGAYNSGPKRPNGDYAAEVETIAGYAQKIMEHAIALDVESARPSVWRRPAGEPDPEAQMETAPATVSLEPDFPDALTYSVGVTPQARIIPQLQAPKLTR